MTLAWIPALAAIALSGFGGVKQDPDRTTSMRKLDYLVGKWEGEGWMMFGPEERSDVTVSMTVESRMNGAALILEGTYMDKETKQVLGRSLGLITYKTSKSAYMAHMVYSNRPEGDFPLEVNDQNFSWKVQLEHGAIVTYRMNKNIEGNWHETASYAMEGSDGVTVMEFTLKPVK